MHLTVISSLFLAKLDKQNSNAELESILSDMQLSTTKTYKTKPGLVFQCECFLQNMSLIFEISFATSMTYGGLRASGCERWNNEKMNP